MGDREKQIPNVYLRGDVYWGRIKIAGREYRDSLRTTDPREAKRRIAGWRKKLERDFLGAGDTPTWKEAVVKWNEEVLHRSVKSSVAKRYMVSIGQMDAAFGNLRVTQITPGRISEYISERSRTATNATIRRDLTALSRLLSACVSWGWLTDNPARNYDRSIIREQRDPITPPAREDVQKVIDAAPPGMASILRLLWQTGMRESEAVNLEARDIDWSGQKITLTRTKTNRPRTIDWTTPGGDASDVLRYASRFGPIFRSAQGEQYRNFSSNFGRVITATAKAEKAAGRDFRRFRVHDLRHAFAINWLRQGGGVYALSLHLGHTSVKTTEVYLGHLTAREQAVAHLGAQQIRNQVVGGTVQIEKM